MTRRCAVFECDTTDPETLYRFPEDEASAIEWKESLKLQEFPIQLLQARFGVCKTHFMKSDFKDVEFECGNSMVLKENAIPTLMKDGIFQDLNYNSSLGISVEESIESPQFMVPTNANISLLQPPSTSKLYRTRSMEFSTASTGGNTDISILKTHNSHYDDNEEDDDDNNALDDIEERNRLTAQRLQESIDAPDFTVVSCSIEESTEVLSFHTLKPLNQNDYSGTDSDIEVLMSEELNDTEWSAALGNLENNTLEMNGKRDDCSIEAILANSMEEDLTTPKSPRRHGSATEHDCSIEEFSRQSSFDGFGLTREQLLNVVREQRVRIRELESILTRYQIAQNALFDHVEAIRQEFAKNGSTNLLLNLPK